MTPSGSSLSVSSPHITWQRSFNCQSLPFFSSVPTQKSNPSYITPYFCVCSLRSLKKTWHSKKSFTIFFKKRSRLSPSHSFSIVQFASLKAKESTLSPSIKTSLFLKSSSKNPFIVSFGTSLIFLKSSSRDLGSIKKR